MSQQPWRDYASTKRLRVPAERIAPAVPGLHGCSVTDRGVANCYRTFPVRCGGRRPEEMQPVFAVTVYSLGPVFVFPLEIFKYDQIRPRYLVSAFHVNQIQPPTGSRAGRCRKGFLATLSALAKREHPLHGDLGKILLKISINPRSYITRPIWEALPSCTCYRTQLLAEPRAGSTEGTDAPQPKKIVLNIMDGITANYARPRSLILTSTCDTEQVCPDHNSILCSCSQRQRWLTEGTLRGPLAQAGRRRRMLCRQLEAAPGVAC